MVQDDVIEVFHMEDDPITLKIMGLREEILKHSGGVGGKIADWCIETVQSNMIVLSCRPGYGCNRRRTVSEPCLQHL